MDQWTKWMTLDAGGLAAHYHFGARRGSAVAFLGACKLLLGLLFGGSLLTLLRRFPAPVLGVMLAAASAELMRAGLGGIIASSAASAAPAPALSSSTRVGDGSGGGGDGGDGGGGDGGDDGGGGGGVGVIQNGGRHGGGSAGGDGEEGGAATATAATAASAAATAGSDVYVLIVTAAATVASKNTGVGCLFGFGASALAAERKRWLSGDGVGGGRRSAGDVEYSEL